MNPVTEVCRMPNWYPRFSANCLPTSFVYLNEEELAALVAGETSGRIVKSVVQRLNAVMKNYSYNRFLRVDTAAPTDTGRFQKKRGAVRSAASAWKVLASSEKVRGAASRNEVTAICVQPFRRIEKTREFRLFIHGGKLKAMSQYWLIRHYRRLVKAGEQYWKLANEFIEHNEWALPVPDIVMDIYFTQDKEILVMDLNPWGAPTDPLMLNTWDQDWQQTVGLRIVPPPCTVSGTVHVSF